MPRRRSVTSNQSERRGEGQYESTRRLGKNTFDILMEDSENEEVDIDVYNEDQTLDCNDNNNSSDELINNSDQNRKEDSISAAAEEHRDQEEDDDGFIVHRGKRGSRRNNKSNLRDDHDKNYKKRIVARSVVKEPVDNGVGRKFEDNNIEEQHLNVDRHHKSYGESIEGGMYVPPTLDDGDWIQTSHKRRYRDRNGDRNSDRDNDRNGEQKENFPRPPGVQLEYYDPSVKLQGDDMKLNSNWKVWIHENSNNDWSLDSYSSIFDIDNIGSMWRFLHVLDCLDKNIRQYYIMREGITPIWEDNNNKNGAICSIMIENMNRHNRHTRGDLGVDAFSAICILVMNESFVKNNLDINGLNYSIKNRNVLIKLWVKDYEDNKNFIDKLPISLLQKLDTIISMMESKGNILKFHGKSRVSVQIKQIKPNY